jgi:carbohydrate diacid regulator
MVLTNSGPSIVTRENQPYVTILTTPFERLASSIAERMAELLCTNIWVLDQQQAVLASKLTLDLGHDFGSNDHAERAHMLRVPFHRNEYRGAVIIDTPVNGEVISPRLAYALIHMVINQALSEDHSSQPVDWKNAFVFQLLQGAATDDTLILQQAKQLGLDLATPRAVLLIDAKDYILEACPPDRGALDETRERRRARVVISSVVGFFHLPNDTICSYIGNGEIVVLKASNTKNLLPWAEPGMTLDDDRSSWANLAALKQAGEALLRHLQGDISTDICIGIGRYHPGAGGIAHSYQDACAALVVGRRYDSTYGVHCLNRLGIAAFVGISDEQTKQELAAHLLSPLDHEPELLGTLQVFFAQNCCPSETARRLVIHRNTLTYRLQKVALLTGLDPRRFDEATQIHLALLLRSSSSLVSQAEARQ